MSSLDPHAPVATESKEPWEAPSVEILDVQEETHTGGGVGADILAEES